MQREINARDILRLAVRHRLVPANKLPELLADDDPIQAVMDQQLLGREDLARLLDAVRQDGPPILPKRPSPDAEDAARAISEKLLAVRTALSWLQSGRLGLGSAQTITWKQDSVGELPTRTSAPPKPPAPPGDEA